MSEEKRLYYYDGCVTSFGKVCTQNWYAETYAVSAKKAKSNLTYRYKKEMNLEPTCKIELPDKIKEG